MVLTFMGYSEEALEENHRAIVELYEGREKGFGYVCVCVCLSIV